MDTPETDKAERMAYAGEYMVPTEVARKLERERDEARNQRDILRLDAQREAEHHDRMICELERVYAERDEAREKLRMANIETNARQEIANALKERDEAREEIVLLKKTSLELESALRRLLNADIPRPLGGIIDDSERQVAIEWNAFERGEARQHAKVILQQNKEETK